MLIDLPIAMSLYNGVRSPAVASCSGHTQNTSSLVVRIRVHPDRYRLSTARGKPSRRSRVAQQRCAAGSTDYYEVLGVSRDADLKQIKQAFKRKALKLHPDVNSAPDAKERFMECKRAYQALSDSRERARYDRGRAGPAGGFSWDDVVSSGERGKRAAEEAFYGLGDFFRDLDKDFEERRKRRGKDMQPMSLWEELSDIGEEFVEFLEKEIGIKVPDTSKYSASSSEDGAGSSSSSADRAAAAEEAARQAREAQERARRAAATAEAGAQRVNDEIDDMLAQMKRDLGIK